MILECRNWVSRLVQRDGNRRRVGRCPQAGELQGPVNLCFLQALYDSFLRRPWNGGIKGSKCLIVTVSVDGSFEK